MPVDKAVASFFLSYTITIREVLGGTAIRGKGFLRLITFLNLAVFLSCIGRKAA